MSWVPMSPLRLSLILPFFPARPLRPRTPAGPCAPVAPGTPCAFQLTGVSFTAQAPFAGIIRSDPRESAQA